MVVLDRPVRLITSRVLRIRMGTLRVPLNDRVYFPVK